MFPPHTELLEKEDVSKFVPPSYNISGLSAPPALNWLTVGLFLLNFEAIFPILQN